MGIENSVKTLQALQALGPASPPPTPATSATPTTSPSCLSARAGGAPGPPPACPHREDRASGLVGPVRDTNLLSQWRTVSWAVRHTHTEPGDAHAGRTPRGPIDPTSPWKAPGMRVGTARGTRGPLELGGVSVYLLTRRLSVGAWINNSAAGIYHQKKAGAPRNRAAQKPATI